MSEEPPRWRFWLCIGVLYVSVGRSPLVRVERAELFTIGFGFSHGC